jgi:hypothetical protein
MNCDNCGTKFEPRRKGRPQRFCPNAGRCRREFEVKARHTGAQVLRETGAGQAPRRRLSEDEQIRRAKDRAAAALKAYNDRRQAEREAQIRQAA